MAIKEKVKRKKEKGKSFLLLFKNVSTRKICWSFKLFLQKRRWVYMASKIKN
jgi:hypothetical protein